MHRGRRLALTDIIIVATMVTLSVPLWDKIFGNSISLKQAHKFPTLSHPLGTDHLGRDLLARLSLAVSDAIVPLWGIVILATLVGIAAGSLTVIPSKSCVITWTRRSFDLSATVLAAIPITITTFVLAACFEQAGVTSVIISIGTIVCARGYLQTRDLIRHSSKLAYWTAHEAMGGTRLSRVWRYGINSAWRQELLAALGVHLSGAVIVEATLSYLGFGVQEPSPSFGNILAAHFAESLKGQWWVMTMTLGALMLTTATPRAILRCLRVLYATRGAKQEAQSTAALTDSVQPMPELSSLR